MAKKPEPKSSKLVPLGDKVVIRSDKATDVSMGGIIIPDIAQGKSQRGVALSVGDGYVLDSGVRVPLAVKEGDRVIFNAYAGVDIKVGDEDLLVMPERDILAVL